jgi:hypothetical protein
VIEAEAPHRLDSGTTRVAVQRTATVPENMTQYEQELAVQQLVSDLISDFNFVAERAIVNDLWYVLL